MPTSVNTASSFTIREVTGDKRLVQLVGRALPYRPFTLKTTQRMDVTWYPGFAEATATILGASEEPTSINGMWKNKFIQVTPDNLTAIEAFDDARSVKIFPVTVDGEPVDNVSGVINLFDDICRKGQLLEVLWDQQARRGHLKEFEKSYLNVNDVQWSMTFEWISRAEATPPAVVTAESSLSDIGNAFRIQEDLLKDAIEPPFAPDPSFINEMDNALNQVTGFVDAVTSLVVQIARGATAPLDAGRRIAGVCDGTIDQMNSTLDFLRTINPIDTRFGGKTGATFGDRISAVSYTRGIERQTREFRRVATFRRASFKRQVEGDVRSIHTAVQGQDLRDVARQYYGDANQWKTLLVFNGLTTAALQAGQIVLVPNPTAAGLPMGC